jgi:hypothetical protein
MENINDIVNVAWDSPIKLVFEQASTDLHKAKEAAIDNAVMEAVVKIGIDIDKDTLTAALQQDRERYIEAYKEGYKVGYLAGKLEAQLINKKMVDDIRRILSELDEEKEEDYD